MRAYTVEIFHKGEPIHLVDLMATDEESACSRARNAIFLAALRDGREYRRDDITASIYETGEVTT